MDVTLGTRLGPYEIRAPLGAGGMGEVYRACDVRLNRTVAVKILPSRVGENPERLMRFEREAWAISGFAHPHICALYDVGRENGTEYLVMEYLEGETLERRLMADPIPLDEFLQYAIEIADALDHAHRRGMVHRDLKPSNIMLTPVGAKLLDFGLAVDLAWVGPACESASSAFPMATRTITDEGTILGTLNYLAPERLEGQKADARADVFAFGAVLYEMITARKAFDGTSQASVIAAVLRSDPPSLTTLQPLVPLALDRVVRKCLEKDPDERWQTARDLLSELKWIRDMRAHPEAQLSKARRSGSVPRVRWIVAGAGVLMVATATLAPLLKTPPPPINEAAAIQFTVLPADGTTLAESAGTLAVSPNGRYVTYAAVSRDGKDRLWVRALDALTPRPLAGTEGARAPFWSPDSRTVAFYADGKLKTIDISGENLQTLAEAGNNHLGGTWSAAGVILASMGPPGVGLLSVPPSGGAPTPATRLNEAQEEVRHTWPVFLPDGRHFLYRARSRQREHTGIYLGSLDSDQRTRLVTADANPTYAAPGYFVYGTNGTLVAQALDPLRCTLTGAPFPILRHVMYNQASGRSAFSASTSALVPAVLSYRPAALTALRWFDRAGRPLEIVAPAGQYLDPILSADGRRVAATRVDPDLGTFDIWTFDGAGRSASPVTSGHEDAMPLWSRDGRSILFASKRNGMFDVFQIPVDGSGPERSIGIRAGLPNGWARDGTFLILEPQGEGGITIYQANASADAAKFSLRQDGSPAVWAQPFTESQGQVSPDGRWLAYTSNVTGQDEVYVRQFADTSGSALKISGEGGVEPKWRHDSRELFFLAKDQRLMSVEVGAGGALGFSAPVPLFASRARAILTPGTGHRQYDVTADGQRFIMNVPVEGSSPPITVVVDWPTALRR
jgi:serine/threonine protein kinase/Tol biopolymer transport system component